jgi:hypothetical protein
MNFQQSITTTVPQALLIRHWHNYFENGQTRRTNTQPYSLMPVDPNALIRKTLLRKGAESYRARTVCLGLITIAMRCPQRGFVVDAEGTNTAERISGAKGIPEPDIRSEMELVANKEVVWIAHVACHNERGAIQEKLTTTMGMPEPDVRVDPELTERKECGRVSHVACHTQTPTLPPQLQPELIHLGNPSATAPDLHIEWGYPIVDKGNGSETERRLSKGLEKLLYTDKEELKEVETVACHTLTSMLAPQYPVACHSTTLLSSTPSSVPRDTERGAIQKESKAATGMSEPDVCAYPELIPNNELKWVSHVACHTQTPTLDPQYPVACHTERVAFERGQQSPGKLSTNFQFTNSVNPIVLTIFWA